LEAVREALLLVPGVEGVHHLHLWQVSEQDTHFEGHITVDDRLVSQVEKIRGAVEALECCRSRWP